MSINVEAENVKLWVNEHQKEDGGKWYTYSISTSSKDQDGSYVNKSLEVRMRREVVIPADLMNGETVTIRGSLSNRSYTNKDGEKRTEHMLWAHEIDFEGRQAPLPSEPADSFEQLDEDMPF